MSPVGDDAPEINIGSRAGYVAGLIREGLSANKILSTLKDNGAGMARQAGLRLVGQVRDSLAREQTISGLPGNQLPDAAQYGTWAMGRGGQYATKVAVYTIDRDSGVAFKNFTTVVTNTPHTPEEAAAQAIDMFNDPEALAAYNQRVTGALPGMMWQTVPFNS